MFNSIENAIDRVFNVFGVRVPNNLNMSISSVLAMSLMVLYQNLVMEEERRPITIEEMQLKPYYDFIIVGAGSAGAVVANRLSEIANWDILLIEAGGHETPVSDVPIMAQYLQLTDLDWQYRTEPSDRYCLAMNEGKCRWPRGKVLGGSSVINYMLYVRGNKRDYDSWEKLGNPGWGYKDVLKYFIKSEDVQDSRYNNSLYHGHGGYLTVDKAAYRSPIADAFVDSAKEFGYRVVDINGKEQTGFTYPSITTRNGRRCSTDKAFIRSAKWRRNLDILINAHVTRVLVHPKKRKAFGVEIYREGKLRKIEVRKEVILSAGALNSPQILMLSGIGPADHLEELNIPVIQNLSVGKNLQDHVGVGGLTFLINKPVGLVEKELHTVNNLIEYGLRSRGPFTVAGGIEGLGFVNTKYADPSGLYPDIEFQFVSGSTNSDGGTQIRKIHGITEEFYNKTLKPIENYHCWSIIPYLLRPNSKGMVKLRSKNPLHPPLLYPNYFQDEFDLLTLVEGTKLVFALSKTKAFKKYGSEISPYIIHGCGHLQFYSDEYWECVVKHYSVTIYHQSCTCKMGPKYDPEAVVDPRLRVYGIEGLRVIDASIMPNVVSANTNAPTIMIGEKGSDLIKEDWLRR